MGACLGSTTASATTPGANYTITIGSSGSWTHPDDSPAAPFTDKDGTFYYQESHADYGASDTRQWSFYSGSNFDTATRAGISDAVNPADAQDKNNDTTWRCNNSPTGLTSTYTTDTGSFAQKNYCDLMGVWVDPDTGDWYGLVHNEFTPEPFGDNSFAHYDAIDVAVSHNQGKVWTITGHALTSPYSTTRGDSAAFPNGTFDYGDGDPRLFVDAASGYFYVQYDSRIVPKAGTAGSADDLAHVARAPMSAKMATGSWTKWYDGSWSQPGIGGLETNLVPATTSDPSGYTPVANDYNPANAGTVDQMIAANELPAKSALATMNIAYDAYLGLYIGEPEVDQSSNNPQQYYVTDDLTTQKWHYIGDSGSYTSESWYRWVLDSVNRTDSTIIGRTFRSYCSFFCVNGSDGTYADETVDSTSPAAPPVDPRRNYTIGNASGQVLAQVSGGPATTSQPPSGSSRQEWIFTADGDGSYRIVNANSGKALGVDSGSTASRAWGTAPTATPLGSRPTVGQQWFLLKNRSSTTNSPDGTFRIVNRYSGLVLGLSTAAGRRSETTPARAWTNTTGNPVGGTRSAADQTLTLTAAPTARR